MNLDEMTVGQLKEVAKLAKGLGGSTCARPKAKLEEKRVILVVDRGWIFAGDQTTTSDGYVLLKNAVHVFRWESMGFAAMVQQGKGPKVDLRPVADVEIPKDSIIFRVPVPANWGL